MVIVWCERGRSRPQIGHNEATDVLQWSRSGRVARSQLESDLIQLQKAHRKLTDVLEISYGAPETSREFEKIIRK